MPVDKHKLIWEAQESNEGVIHPEIDGAMTVEMEIRGLT